MDEIDTGLIDRVRKLLAMAEGTSNPNEADAFSRKAAELIAAHRIDPAHLAASEGDELRVLEVDLGRGAYVRGRLALLMAVANAHGCPVVFQVRDAGTVALVAGFRSDLDTVEILYHSLHQQAATRMAGERRATGPATQRFRRSFLFGYASQIAGMLTATEREAIEHAAASDALPVLQSRRERVERFAGERFGRVVAARRPTPATIGGWEAGRRAASRADVGHRRVGTRLAIGSGG